MLNAFEQLAQREPESLKKENDMFFVWLLSNLIFLGTDFELSMYQAKNGTVFLFDDDFHLVRIHRDDVPSEL